MQQALNFIFSPHTDAGILLSCGYRARPARRQPSDRRHALLALPYEPQLLEPATYGWLRAGAACLIPLPDRAEPFELAAGVDQPLACGGSDGWRDDSMPPDRGACRLGLDGINQSSQAFFQQGFRALEPSQQAWVLHHLQA